MQKIVIVKAFILSLYLIRMIPVLQEQWCMFFWSTKRMKYGQMQPKVINTYDSASRTIFQTKGFCECFLNCFACFVGRRRRWFSIDEAWVRLSHRPSQQSYLCDVMRSKWKMETFFCSVYQLTEQNN